MDKWFYEQALLGNVYHAHNTTAGEVTVIHATYTGLVISNPVGSNKILVMKNAQFANSTLAAIAEVGLVVSPTMLVAVQTGTAAVIHNAKLSGSNSNPGRGQALSVATLLTTPVWYKTMGSVELTGSVESGMNEANLNGDTLVTPGQYIAIATLTTARTGLCSFTWAEIDE
jgi:hypothetical protein|tara:strand:- start:4177 stop:4689 length:513 start_codon:yes stop_codon:yes gene_type:complete